MSHKLTYWIGDGVSGDVEAKVEDVFERLRSTGVQISRKFEDHNDQASTQAILSQADLNEHHVYHCDVTLISEIPPASNSEIQWLHPDDLSTHNENLKKFVQNIERRSRVAGLWERYEQHSALAGDIKEARIQFETSQENQQQEAVDRLSNNFAKTAGDEFVKLVVDDDWMDPAGQAWVAAKYAKDCALHAQRVANTELGKFIGHTKPHHRTGLIWGRLVWGRKNADDFILYEGETDGVNPHGHGVLVFGPQASPKQAYWGQFIDGVRSGFGEAREDLDSEMRGRLNWRGAWQDDQPHGYGVYTSGRREASQIHKQGRIELEKENQKMLWFFDMPHKPVSHGKQR